MCCPRYLHVRQERESMHDDGEQRTVNYCRCGAVPAGGERSPRAHPSPVLDAKLYTRVVQKNIASWMVPYFRTPQILPIGIKGHPLRSTCLCNWCKIPQESRKTFAGTFLKIIGAKSSPATTPPTRIVYTKINATTSNFDYSQALSID